ncbi:ribonuclease H-like protein [Cylindrobasidium torrendii FP15055 ss-10]|uniref:3'-5' exonuclease n=1 Tax=Cylindrobasidium torrendii FP15055 ss-10 TaxID=1314674 RepID=A0A0D7BAJ0_9AGAR|nr:ribonuclease H-like protein [Cylindrobasidium torrendii FP15055 ss-10]
MSQSKHIIHTAPHTSTSDALAEDKPPALPPYNWAGQNSAATLFYVTSLPEADALLAKHLSFTSGVVGFDLEWPPTFRKGQPENPVSLVQIASQDAVFLFQISKMRSFPVQLQTLLENPLVIKAGVSVKSDAQKLWRDCNIHVLGCAELSYLARSADNARWKGSYKSLIGLARLTEVYLGGVLDKGHITRSNWGAKLTPQQQAYAANDAYAGYSLYVLLKAMVDVDVDPTCYTFNVVRGLLYDITSTTGKLLTTEEAVWEMPASKLSPWRALNPAYDPGPLPERKPKTGDGDRGPTTEATTTTTATTATATTTTTTKKRYHKNLKRSQGPTRRQQEYTQSISLLPPQA